MAEKKAKSRFGSSPAALALKEQLLKIKKEKLYPRGYAQDLADTLNAKKKEGEKLITKEYIWQVANCAIYNEEVVDGLLRIASENKLTKQIAKAKDILS